jgi:hypothetical protein
MREKYRIAEVYSLNAFDSSPETNFMVEKWVKGTWDSVQMFIHEEEAELKITELKLADEVRKIKRRNEAMSRRPRGTRR